MTDFPFWLQHLIDRIARATYLGARHFLIIAAVFIVIWLCLRKWPGKRVTMGRAVKASQLWREAGLTAVSFLVFGSVMPILFALGFANHTQFYWNVERHGWGYFALSIVLMMLIQDTWFYWTHRAMHSRFAFKWIHRTHHKSVTTNPLTTYSISPLEGLVNSGAGIVTLMLIPTTGLALFIFSWINTIYAVYGHLGYELFPRSTAGHWLGRWINTSVAHSTHHGKGRYNYGWYFLFWDRAMGTLDPDYVERYRAARP
jgi:Delta7-sterol 5-desaturase